MGKPTALASDVVAFAKPLIDQLYRDVLAAQKQVRGRSHLSKEYAEYVGEIRGIQAMRKIFNDGLAAASEAAARRSSSSPEPPCAAPIPPNAEQRSA
jgi:hypothetical protein